MPKSISFTNPVLVAMTLLGFISRKMIGGWRVCR